MKPKTICFDYRREMRDTKEEKKWHRERLYIYIKQGKKQEKNGPEIECA